MRVNVMEFWSTCRRRRLKWALSDSGGRFAELTDRTCVLQWAIASMVGLGLGVYLAVTNWLRPDWTPLFVLAVLFPFLAMAVGDVRKFLLAVILVELPLQLDVSLYYDGHAVSLGAIGGLNVSLTTLCLAILYALWMAEVLAKVTPLRRFWFRASLPLVAYLGAVILSTVVARAADFAFFEIFLLFQAFLLYLYVIKAVRTRRDVLFIVGMLLIGLLLQGAVMIGLRIIRHDINFLHVSARIDPSGRVAGTIGSPNTAASYLVLLLAPALSVLITSLDRRYKSLAVLSFGLGCVALLLTFSRGGWLACTISIALFCIFALYRGWLSPRVFLTVATVLALLFLLWGDAVLARLLGDDGGAAASRIPLAQLAIRMIRDHPILGIGANNFGTMLGQYITAEFADTFLYTVHNKYLLVWAETGIIGLGAFLGFMFAVIRRGWQGWRFRDRLLSPIALGFAVAIVGQMVHMFFDVFHSRPQVQVLWVVAGLVTAMHNIGRRAGG